MSSDASDRDIQTLLDGLLSSEAQARYAALQAAQVSLFSVFLPSFDFTRWYLTYLCA